jgi:hypothetical protein
VVRVCITKYYVVDDPWRACVCVLRANRLLHDQVASGASATAASAGAAGAGVAGVGTAGVSGAGASGAGANVVADDVAWITTLTHAGQVAMLDADASLAACTAAGECSAPGFGACESRSAWGAQGGGMSC